MYISNLRLASILGIAVIFGIAYSFTSIIADSNSTKTDKMKEVVEKKFHVPSNTEIDWEVDHMRRVRVFIPDYAQKDDYSEGQINTLVESLKDPKKYVAAHVILTNLYGGTGLNYAEAVREGYDISYFILKVQLRYSADGRNDKKVVFYPVRDPSLGSHQEFLAQKWRGYIKWLQRTNTLRKSLVSKKDPSPIKLWCGKQLFDLKKIDNKHVKWTKRGFGDMSPFLQGVDPLVTASGNTKHVEHLKLLLDDESRFVAAHIALCFIFGLEDNYSAQHFGSYYKLHLNGLHVVIKNSKKYKVEYIFPNIASQQAWLKYQWHTSLPELMKSLKKKTVDSKKKQ